MVAIFHPTKGKLTDLAQNANQDGLRFLVARFDLIHAGHQRIAKTYGRVGQRVDTEKLRFGAEDGGTLGHSNRGFLATGGRAKGKQALMGADGALFKIEVQVPGADDCVLSTVLGVNKGQPSASPR